MRSYPNYVIEGNHDELNPFVCKVLPNLNVQHRLDGLTQTNFLSLMGQEK
ncbi:MAG: hypothetical protein HQK54_01550 [Oligoflexales bacterium]|nr:hypothetical protein [Oligoflexales bacterium]